jgi:hypothetical protein
MGVTVTYCLGWTAHDAAFLVADAAATRPPGGIREGESSFGEQHLDDDSRRVEQEALKINPLPFGGITFAGSSRLGSALVRITRGAVRGGERPDAAFRAAYSSLQPLEGGDPLQAILAWHDMNDSHLLWSEGNGQSFSEGQLVQLGSMDAAFKQLTADAIRSVSERHLGAPALLAGAMSLIQSYGISHGLIETGVGGQINGAWIGEDGGDWQPDLLCVLYDSENVSNSMTCISSIVRDSVAVVGSSVTRDTRCFATELTEQELEAWKSRWIPEVLNYCSKGKADYVCFLDRRHWRVVLVEQLGRLESSFLRFTPTEPGSRAAPIDLSLRVLRALTRDMEGQQMAMEFIA